MVWTYVAKGMARRSIHDLWSTSLHVSDLCDINAIKNRQQALLGHVRHLSTTAPAHDALQATVDALSVGTTPNLQVARGGKSPNNLTTRESDALHRNVIYKLPSYELQLEISHGGGRSDSSAD